MPSYSLNLMAKWRNYHLTEQGRYEPRFDNDPYFGRPGFPDGSIRDCATFYAADLAGADGPTIFRKSAETVQKLLAAITRVEDLPVPKTPPRDCVAIGRGWSFAPLVGAIDTQIDMTGLAAMALADATLFHPDAQYQPGTLAMVAAGTRLRELTTWAQDPFKLSIMTSGTHLGLTIGGAIATSSHGSRLGYGGIQNMVAGLHIVTGPGSSVWIEPASQPVLSDEAVRRFTATPAIRSDAFFEDVLVHLGGMGIVVGVALALVPDQGFALLAKQHPIDDAWLRAASDGEFDTLAAELGGSGTPAFYELTLDPWAWDSNDAVHTMYLPTEGEPLFEAFAPARLSFADSIGEIRQALESALQAPGFAPTERLPPFPPVFALYRQRYLAQDIVQHPPKHARWNQLHGDEITGGYPGALYNASFAIPRAQLAEVVPLLCAAVADLLPTFLFTVRFVSGARGTMAFTRFPDCAVIEIDGISRNAPAIGDLLGANIEIGAQRIRACLDGANPAGKRFEHSMHWAKLGKLDSAKVARDYGDKLDRWRAAREQLLSERMRALLWNQALVDYGLIEGRRRPFDKGDQGRCGLRA